LRSACSVNGATTYRPTLSSAAFTGDSDQKYPAIRKPRPVRGFFLPVTMFSRRPESAPGLEKHPPQAQDDGTTRRRISSKCMEVYER
jgi:hypothetical protein